ncbi:E3 ubiquitin-protein ligase KCMF1-like [Drosophila biarmipes]|uniref:E3 ubiquitin-protein ligase KCMF1-like n=1 Tax=Drosophila biarmipes TaxID=125945 RepID=UPI0021CC6C02|nr:E3 ubiquitin-protein ligase KCMF1-like [Drosophila biarmipes]
MQNERDESHRHMGITCSGCLRQNFPGRRFHCLSCLEEFNLCNGCYALDATTKEHKFDHAMHCILTPASLALFYTQEELGAGKYPMLIRCPYCKINNFNLEEFERHLQELHPSADPDLLSCYKLHV